MPTPTQLAARQLKLTFWGGLVLVVPLSSAFALLMEGGHNWPSELPVGLEVARAALGTIGLLAGWAALPALLAGWLRLRPMRWLFGLPQLRAARSGRQLGVGGTFCLFMGTVLLGALLLHLYERRIEFSIDLKLCTGFSLPWLLSSLWATWRVLRPTQEVA